MNSELIYSLGSTHVLLIAFPLLKNIFSCKYELLTTRNWLLKTIINKTSESIRGVIINFAYQYEYNVVVFFVFVNINNIVQKCVNKYNILEIVFFIKVAT